MAKELARKHYEVEPGLTRVIRFSGSADVEAVRTEPIKLLEVNQYTVPSGVMPLRFGPAVASGSIGGLTIVPAAGPLNAVLGALPEDNDATPTAVATSVHHLALQQVSEFAWGRRMSRRRRTDA